jgi:hypothetical protein
MTHIAVQKQGDDFNCTSWDTQDQTLLSTETEALDLW